MKMQAERPEGTNAISRHAPEGVIVAGVEHRHSVLVPWHGEVQPWAVDRFETLEAASFEPVIALAPILVLIFGLGITTKIVIAAIICFFPTLVNMIRGLEAVTPSELELMRMVATAARYDQGPIAFRYPRGEGVGIDLPERAEPLQIGKGRVVREGTRAAILSFGARLQEALLAADDLAAHGISTTVADARFAKPLDAALIARLAARHQLIVTIEEGSLGGFGSFAHSFSSHFSFGG